MPNSTVRAGVIGCGDISAWYFRANRAYEGFSIVACADLDPERARARAREFDIPRACTVEELLADETIKIVVNLTIPKAHAAVNRQAIEAGKSPYTEKPLAVTREEARETLALARERGLRVGCAPDTFLGGSHQAGRRLLDEGWIGEPLSATAFLLHRGPEAWHPNPDFFYQDGAGPLFDMGPYYLTALIHLLGPIRRVSGTGRIGLPERVIGSGERAGETIQVQTPTHVTAAVEFEAGPVATLVTSYEVTAHRLPQIEIYGTDGTLSIPDPNRFDGEVRLFAPGKTLLQNRGKSLPAGPEWTSVKWEDDYNENMRGAGPADMARALRSGRPHRASGDLAYHVLDAMHGILESAERGASVELESRCERPAPLPAGLPPGRLDE